MTFVTVSVMTFMLFQHDSLRCFNTTFVTVPVMTFVSFQRNSARSHWIDHLARDCFPKSRHLLDSSWISLIPMMSVHRCFSMFCHSICDDIVLFQHDSASPRWINHLAWDYLAWRFWGWNWYWAFRSLSSCHPQDPTILNLASCSIPSGHHRSPWCPPLKHAVS